MSCKSLLVSLAVLGVAAVGSANVVTFSTSVTGTGYFNPPSSLGPAFLRTTNQVMYAPTGHISWTIKGFKTGGNQAGFLLKIWDYSVNPLGPYYQTTYPLSVSGTTYTINGSWTVFSGHTVAVELWATGAQYPGGTPTSVTNTYLQVTSS